MIEITPGPILYKYRPLVDSIKKDQLHEFTYKILSDCGLYFAKPNSFNDLFDLKIPIETNVTKEDYFENLKKRLLFQGYNITQEDVLQIEDEIGEAGGIENFIKKEYAISQEIYNVCCLSRNCLDPRMWGYYADSGKGICIGFKTYYPENEVTYITTKDGQIPKENQNFLPFVNINYVNERLPIVNFFDNKKDQKKILEEMTYHLLSKDARWSYEEEMRAIMKNNELITQNVLLPKTEICEIIFGYNISQELKDKVFDLLKTYPNEGKDIQFFEIEPSTDKYELIKKVITR